MPAGKIKESLWLGTVRIFLSSMRGQGGVRQLDGALGGLWGLGWPPKPKRPRVQVPAESNQGEIWECHSCSQQRCSVAQLSLPLSPILSCPNSPFSVACFTPPLTFLDTHKHTHTEKDAYFKHEARSTRLLVCVCVCLATGTEVVFVCV